jgi:hypothetical protein
LTTGKLNAVRAAFKVGVKPSAIAMQFGIFAGSAQCVDEIGQRGAGVNW